MAEKQSASEMEREIAELRAKLNVAERERTEAQTMAAELASASGFMNNSEEQPTGETVEMSVCLNPAVRDEKKQKFHTVKVPTYFYAINLPVGAGTSLTTNGIAYYHGQTYEVTPDVLADLKSRVARCWDHEKSIHSENANAYQKPTNTHLISKAAASRIRH